MCIGMIATIYIYIYIYICDNLCNYFTFNISYMTSEKYIHKTLYFTKPKSKTVTRIHICISDPYSAITAAEYEICQSYKSDHRHT
jgi:hypothetical protein